MYFNVLALSKIVLFFIAVTLTACEEQAVTDTLASGIIENRVFTTTVLIDGHRYDGTVIRNCTFENIDGDGLQLRDVDNLRIENCTFRNIGEDAIRFRNSGISDGVQIIDNEIYNIKQNGILAPEGHVNTIIRGNIIYNVATDNTSSRFGAPHHGIYFQGFDVTITENTIYNVRNDNGNCISIRTYGTISKNRLYAATDHGISYFSDHPGEGKQLLIENNLIYDNGKRGINLASNGNTTNHIGSAWVRFNTIISSEQSPVGINEGLTRATFDIEANILIRTDGKSTFVFANLPIGQVYNVTGFGDIGFVDFADRELNIVANSTANNAAVGITDYPVTDFAGINRQAVGLDAGAYALE